MRLIMKCPCRLKDGIHSMLLNFRSISSLTTDSCPGSASKKKWVTGLGQPSFLTHPHLVKENELVPGLLSDEFITRRAKLAESVHLCKPDRVNLILIPSSTTKYMSDKIPYVFRQNTDFRYMTGCLEPDSALLMVVTPEEGNLTSYMLVRSKNDHSETWEGPRTGVDMAAEVFNVDEAKPVSELDIVLKDLREKYKSFILWYDFLSPVHADMHKTVVSFLSTGGSNDLEAIKPKIHELRVIKSEAEQRLMISSAEVASKAILSTMKIAKPGGTEHQLFAAVDYHCRMNGAEYLAYPPVVATGNNATIIHYINNNQQLTDGELILMDAGCELHGYCSDITRTWPVSGKFSDVQKTLYEIVLSVQTDIIAACSKLHSLEYLFRLMCQLLGKRLQEAHVLSKKGSELTSEEIAFKLCPHHIGHFLGMDVHDTSHIPRKLPCREGMVITVEPGVYINLRNELTKREFKGIGIRIEDDVLFTKSGPKVLSSVPKTVNDIEKLFQNT